MTHPKGTILPRLSPGSHRPDGEACVIEAVTVYAGWEWSDHPPQLDPSLAANCRIINDNSPQWVRDELRDRIPAIARARKLPDSWRWVWAEAARQSAIRALGPKLGKQLSSCAPITDRVTATAAVAAADQAVAVAPGPFVAEAAYDASRAVTYAIYGDAAYAANAAASFAAHAAASLAAHTAYSASVGSGRREWGYALALIDRACAEACE